MSKKSAIVMPDTQLILEKMGGQIKLARLRRNLSSELIAENDEFGRRIQDMNLVTPKRAKRSR